MLFVSYGAGTNSTAMLIGMRDIGITPDLILFADTGGEKPHTYNYIDVMNNWLSNNGMPTITIVKSPNETLEESCIKNKCLPSVAYGGFKTCSQRFKIAPQDKYLNNLDEARLVWSDGGKIIKAIGFDADEPQRAKKYDSKKYDQWYPLLEWDWGRDECIEAIKKSGLPLPGKSSCFFCPNAKKSEIRELKYQYPELALRAVEMEDNADLTTISGLGRNWAWGDLLKNGELFDFDDRPSDMPCGCYDGD